jgi:hypothetical protein
MSKLWDSAGEFGELMIDQSPATAEARMLEKSESGPPVWGSACLLGKN